MSNAGNCKICNMTEVAIINQMILENATATSIVKRYQINPRTLAKHKKQCLATAIQANDKAKKAFTSDALLKNVEDKIKLIDRMIYGCSDYLTDPENPDKFFLGARSDEISIVYRTRNERTKALSTIQKKATLQELLNKVESTDTYVISNTSIKHSDPRDLLLKGVSELKAVAKLLIDATQVVVENEHKNKAIDKAIKEGGSISFEKMVETISERVTIAMTESNTEELSELAELPEL